MRIDRELVILKVASMVLGVASAGFGLLVLGELFLLRRYKRSAKVLSAHVGRDVWIEGKVKGEALLKPYTIKDHQDIVSNEYQKVVYYNNSQLRLEKLKINVRSIQRNKFSLITEGGEVKVYPNGQYSDEMIFNCVKYPKLSHFELLKAGFSLILSIFRIQPVIQDLSIRETERVIVNNSIYSAFGKLIQDKEGFSLIPKYIVKNKSELIKRKSLSIFFLTIATLCMITARRMLSLEIQRLERRPQVVKADKNLKCLECRSEPAVRLLQPCMHLGICETCNVFVCPQCGTMIENQITTKYNKIS